MFYQKKLAKNALKMFTSKDTFAKAIKKPTNTKNRVSSKSNNKNGILDKTLERYDIEKLINHGYGPDFIKHVEFYLKAYTDKKY